MPFFKESERLKNKKIVTLQVQIPIKKNRLFAKRVLSSAFGFMPKASLTVEAAMVLPLFLFFMVLLMMPMEIMNQGRRIQTALETTGEELSQYAYVLDQLKQGEKIDAEKMEGFSEAFLDGLTEQGILLYARKKVEGQVDLKRVEKVSFAKSSVLQDGETIDLIMNYRVRLPFSVFGLKSVPMTARSCRRAWVGKEGGKGIKDGENEEIVYVGKGSVRYHRSRTCHYLYNDLQQTTLAGVENLRNLSGGKYKPCSRCGKAAAGDSAVYVMPSGERYHTDKNCSSITSYVSAVSISEVRHLGPCSYCSH